MTEFSLNEVTAAHGYPDGEEVAIEDAFYMAGSVNRETLIVSVRMGNDDTILEANLDVGELRGVIDALEGNVGEIEALAALSEQFEPTETSDEIIEQIAVVVSEDVATGDYPTMRLLVAFIESAGLWEQFALWAAAAQERADAGVPDNG